MERSHEHYVQWCNKELSLLGTAFIRNLKQVNNVGTSCVLYQHRADFRWAESINAGIFTGLFANPIQ